MFVCVCVSYTCQIKSRKKCSVLCVRVIVRVSVSACPGFSLAAEIPVGYNSRLIKGFGTLCLVNDCCVLC